MTFIFKRAQKRTSIRENQDFVDRPLYLRILRENCFGLKAKKGNGAAVNNY